MNMKTSATSAMALDCKSCKNPITIRLPDVTMVRCPLSVTYVIIEPKLITCEFCGAKYMPGILDAPVRVDVTAVMIVPGNPVSKMTNPTMIMGNDGGRPV